MAVYKNIDTARTRRLSRDTFNKVLRPKPIVLSRAISYCVDQPFTVFECESFLPASEFSELKSEFPLEVILTSSEHESFRYRIDEYGHPNLFKDLLSSRPHLASLVESIQSHIFVRDLLRTFRRPILARLHSKSKFRRTLLRFAPTWVFDIKVDLTVYSRGFHLTPHTDGIEKVISLLLYFEDPRIEQQHRQETQILGGTKFWRARSKESEEAWLARLLPASRSAQRTSYVLSLQLDRKFDQADALSDEFAEFTTDFVVFHVSKARDNLLAGFVKSSNSWHSVDLSEYPANVLRGAILINLNLPPISLRRCANNFLRQYRLSRFLR